MKLGSFLVFFLALVPGLASAQIDWTHRVIEGEDATSASYYFYQSNGDSVDRIRWVWNGGAQNLPTVTDFIFEVGAILVRHSEGKREFIDDLTEGKDVNLMTRSEYRLKSDGSASVLLPDSGEKTLTEAQRTDLKNLIDLLSKERLPWQP